MCEIFENILIQYQTLISALIGFIASYCMQRLKHSHDKKLALKEEQIKTIRVLHKYAVRLWSNFTLLSTEFSNNKETKEQRNEANQSLKETIQYYEVNAILLPEKIEIAVDELLSEYKKMSTVMFMDLLNSSQARGEPHSEEHIKIMREQVDKIYDLKSMLKNEFKKLTGTKL